MYEYYLTIDLIESSDIGINFLLSKIFMQIHLALVEIKNISKDSNLALAFPQYNEFNVGRKLRIFADRENDLVLFKKIVRLNQYQDYLAISHINKVDINKVEYYVSYTRYQPDASVYQKAKRFIKRHPEYTYESVFQFMKSKKLLVKIPYIKMKSLNNHNSFSLFIKCNKVENLKNGKVNSYGLGVGIGVAIPHFK